MTNTDTRGDSEALGHPLHLRPSLAAFDEPLRDESTGSGGEEPCKSGDKIVQVRLARTSPGIALLREVAPAKHFEEHGSPEP